MSTQTNHAIRVDFDYNWQCYCRQTNKYTDDVIDILSSNILDANLPWTSVTLPHIVDSVTQSNCNITGSYDWWYQKQFNWGLFDQQQEHQVSLIFDSFNDEHDSNSLNVTATVWLNGKQISSDSLLSQQKPIELTHKLLQSYDTTEKNNHKNILIVRCANTSLSLHARLIIHGTVIWGSGHVTIDDKIMPNNDDSNDQKPNNIIDYSVCINDDDRRIDVVLGNSEEKTEGSPTEPFVEPIIDETQTKENREKLKDIWVPRLAIVILTVGTRGDVQPFIALGQALLAAGHRVRLATHETFRSFVRDNGLEFFPLAADPADLMSFMVKNAGIIPSMGSIVAGDVSKRLHTIADILESTWLACTANDDETLLPFTAEAIIANPPSFGHIHCAEKLQIPLHIMFTMPWTPTTAFPHPLCNMDRSKGSIGKINFYSYHIIDMLIWSGMHSFVNHFRKKILSLSPLHSQQGTNALINERVPHTYCWSPSLVSTPSDWEKHIDVSGFFFLDLGTAYHNPPQDLLDFLGISNDHPDDPKLSPPIYIGFGSITGHDSHRLLRVIIDALDKTGYRALLAGLATETDQLPETIFKIGNVPHDWLFQHVSAVCHHGGAGTTATGLRAGKPTIIVPFFGDQFFWGNVVEKSGAGPRPLPGKSVTATELAEAFQFVHQSTTRDAAERIRSGILKENGCQAAVRSFHANLPIDRMRSDLQSTYNACYRIQGFNIQISRPVAYVLIAAGAIDISQLRSHNIREWQLKHTRHNHKLTNNPIVNTKKSRSATFTDTNWDSRLINNRSTSNLELNVSDHAETIASNFQHAMDHLSLHSSSSYGKMVDAVNHVSSLKNPCSKPTTQHQPDVTDSKAGIKSTVLSLYHRRRASFIDFLKKSPFGHQDHSGTGTTALALIIAANYAIQPAVSSLPPMTWLGQSSYDTVKAAVERYKTNAMINQAKTSDLALLSLIKSNEQEQEDCDEFSSTVNIASVISGFHPEICQQILLKFDQIKTEREQTVTSPSHSKNDSKQKPDFRRQRSYSTSAIN